MRLGFILAATMAPTARCSVSGRTVARRNCSVRDLLVQLAVDEKTIVVQRNEDIVARSDFEDVELRVLKNEFMKYGKVFASIQIWSARKTAPATHGP